MNGIIKNSVMLLLIMICVSVSAQEEARYRRSSLYSILINHSDQKFANEIRNSFVQIPVPDKYNDHELAPKVFQLNGKLKNASSDRENPEITDFLERNQVASRLVGKWFNRDIYTGVCDMDLVKERGLYDATEFDRQMAERSARGKAMLEDAGEELIGHTFVLVNDIRYIDKAQKSALWGGILAGLGAAAGASLGNANLGRSVTNLSQSVGNIVETIKGFKVKINTFLYQLVWDDETAAVFYEKQYTDVPDPAKRDAFNNARGTYRLKYVGKVESKGSTTSFMGVNLDKPENMVRKACQRAIDENIVDLQTEFEEFRTFTPILTSEPITASIGMKEGVSAKSRFEVLERVEESDGSYSYKRVGVVAPVEDQIWDNRYMAVEEGAKGATLGRTTFKKVSGSTPMAGMLIREI
jgi:hypothetical protein